MSTFFEELGDKSVAVKGCIKDARPSILCVTQDLVADESDVSLTEVCVLEYALALYHAHLTLQEHLSDFQHALLSARI
jgi:hypothetical protein